MVNAAADTTLNLRYILNGKTQQLFFYAMDGVAADKAPRTMRSIVLGPGARAEFIVITSKQGDTAQLITAAWDAGPAGDRFPTRTLANIVPSGDTQTALVREVPDRVQHSTDERCLRTTVDRHLFFTQVEDEENTTAINDDANTKYYIFIPGVGASQFSMTAPPDLIVHQNTVEDWTITNSTFEDHVFHIHQLHFQFLETNGRPVDDVQIRDTITVAHMTAGNPVAPSVKLRMNFSGANIVGTFLYQCHIATHAEAGMMGTIQVLPPGTPTSLEITAPATAVRGPAVTVTVRVRPELSSQVEPAGTVQFAVNGEVAGSFAQVVNGEAVKTFEFPISALYNISALYSGDIRFNASQTRAPLSVAFLKQ